MSSSLVANPHSPLLHQLPNAVVLCRALPGRSISLAGRGVFDVTLHFLSCHSKPTRIRKWLVCSKSGFSSEFGDDNRREESCDVVRIGSDFCQETSDRTGVVQERNLRGLVAEGALFSRRAVLHVPVVLGAGIVDAQQRSGSVLALAEEVLALPPLPSALTITKRVFLDVAIEGRPIGQIVIGLYGDAVPVGAQRFAELAAGQRGIGYRRKEFYKIGKNYIQNVGVRAFSLTGGTEDAAKFTGGDTADTLVDEMEQLEAQRRRPKHGRGSVSLVALDPTRPPPKAKLVAKNGSLVMIEEQVRPPPNGTEFMIATADAPELDATNTVVGHVLQGMDVLDRIHNVNVVSENTSSPYFQVAKLIGDSRAVVAEKGFNRPYEKVLIVKSGEVQ